MARRRADVVKRRRVVAAEAVAVAAISSMGLVVIPAFMKNGEAWPILDADLAWPASTAAAR